MRSTIAALLILLPCFALAQGEPRIKIVKSSKLNIAIAGLSGGDLETLRRDLVNSGYFTVTGADQAQYTAKGGDLFFSNDTSVWTATTSTGVLNSNGATCAGWTSALGTDKGSYGTLTRIGVDWTDDQGFDATSKSSPCSSRLRLYCFEQ